MKPTLYLTMGLPASGKTYFSERLARDINCFFLNFDGLRLAMFEHPTFTLEEHAMVYRTAGYIAEQHLAQGRSIICNANYHLRDRRNNMRQITQKLHAELCILWVRVPYELAKTRIQSRDHDIPKEKMVHPPLELLERMNEAFEAPSASEPYIIIDGAKPYQEQYQQFLESQAAEPVR